MSPPISVRPLRGDELPGFFDVIETAFGAPMSAQERANDTALLELDRTLVAAEGTRIVGTAAMLSLQLALPGSSAPVAGVSAVSVAPDRRRRGVLRTLMQRQLADLQHNRGEPVAALFSTQPGIYGRFGYGQAARHLDVSLPHRPAFRSCPDFDLDVAPAPAALPRLAGLYDRCWRTRPGYFARSDQWWQALTGGAPQVGCSPTLAAVGEGGYALYRTCPKWHEGRPLGRVEVVEVLALDAPWEAALWSYLTHLDLMDEVHVRMLAPDAALFHLLRDRAQARCLLRENLWVRLVDVPRALVGRRYASTVTVVLDVRDRLCPANEGCFRLEVDDQHARCERTAEPPDLTLDVSALGAVYLGGTTLLELATAGLVEERRPGSLVQASVAFRGLREPCCPTIF
ncbi:MAG: GNAT family N-acetyltransferase [Mycobacteriales bacterium]